MKFFKVVLPLSLVLSLNSLAQVPGYVPTTDIIGWWPLNGNLIDSSSNTNDGSGNFFTYQADRFGAPGKACDFAVNNAYIRFSNLPFNTNGTYTINYWMNLHSYQDLDIIQDLHPSDECGAYPQIWQKFDSLFIVKCGIVPSRMPLGSKTSFLNKWTMLTQVVKSDSTFIYLNGTLQSKFPYTWSSSTAANLFMGNGYNFSQQYVTGSNVTIDDIGLWTRALTDCEITGLFQALSIARNPVAQTGVVGGNVSFSVATSNNASTTYQWQSNIGAGGAFIDLANGGQYSGVTNDTLVVSGLTAANKDQLFRCVVSQGACSITTSDSAAVKMNITGIHDHDDYISSVLEQNVPNPVSGSTTINYYVPVLRGNAMITISDAGGRKVWSRNIDKAGKGQFTLNRQQLEKGVYFYSLIIDGRNISTKKMIFIY